MKKDNRGFTLVELVVSVALLAIILVPTIGFFTNSFKVQNKSALKTSITRVGQHIIENFKNKNYLEFSVGNTSLKDYINANVNENAEYLTGTKLLQDEDGNYEYNNVNYNVDMEVTKVDMSNLKNADMPDVNDYSNFDCVIGISESASFARYKTNDIIFCDVGGNFTDPINSQTYTANYPTIIIGDSFTGDKLLIENNYFIMVDPTTSRQGIVRVIKKPSTELKVYIKGKNLSIKKGQEGDGASSAQTRITSYYVGDGTNEESYDEILLNVKMTITNRDDKDIRDTFNFSFPVDKED